MGFPILDLGPDDPPIGIYQNISALSIAFTNVIICFLSIAYIVRCGAPFTSCGLIGIRSFFNNFSTSFLCLVATAGICVSDKERPYQLVSASFNKSFNLIIFPIPFLFGLLSLPYPLQLLLLYLNYQLS